MMTAMTADPPEISMGHHAGAGNFEPNRTGPDRAGRPPKMSMSINCADARSRARTCAPAGAPGCGHNSSRKVRRARAKSWAAQFIKIELQIAEFNWSAAAAAVALAAAASSVTSFASAPMCVLRVWRCARHSAHRRTHKHRARLVSIKYAWVDGERRLVLGKSRM